MRFSMLICDDFAGPIACRRRAAYDGDTTAASSAAFVYQRDGDSIVLILQYMMPGLLRGPRRAVAAPRGTSAFGAALP